MKKINLRQIVVLFVILISLSSFAVSGSLAPYPIEGFEDSLDNWTVGGDGSRRSQITSDEALYGNNSYWVEGSTGGYGEVETDFSVQPNSSLRYNLSYSVLMKQNDFNHEYSALTVRLEDPSNAIGFRHQVHHEDARFIGSVGNTTQINPSPVTIINPDNYEYDKFYNYTMAVNYADMEVIMYINDIAVYKAPLTAELDDSATMRLRAQKSGTGASSEFIAGYFDHIVFPEDNIYNVSGNVTNEQNNTISNATVEIKNSSGITVANLTTDINGSWNTTLQTGDYTITVKKGGYEDNTKSFSVGTSDKIVNTELIALEEELIIELQKWMYPNTTQHYKGIYLPSSGYTIVTDKLTVTSDNTSVIAVNESTNQLIAQPNVNNTANVTFEYKYLKVTKEITVSHRTLEYIHILPSTQWASAVLGLDDPNTEYGMGSEMQWIFVAIILSSLLASIGDNEWIGLGSIIMVMTLLWILDNVGLGMVLSTLFFGLFLALTLMDVPRGNTTKINVEGNNSK